MKRFSFPLLVMGVVLAAVAGGWGIGQWRKQQAAPVSNPTAQQNPGPGKDRGPVVYQVYCATCHGPEGHGDGPSAITIRPRDFAARPWRFEPSLDGIRKVTLEGIPKTGMLSFRVALSPTDLEAVVAYVYKLATVNPKNQKPLSEEEQILASAGFANLLGTPPPPLTLTDAKGKTTKLSDFSGKLVMLHFWGTSCTHCIKEIPALNELEKQYDGELKILHICTDEEEPAAAQKVLDQAVPGTVALTEANGLGLARYEIQSLPTVWFIAPNGTTIGRSEGTKDWSTPPLDKLIRQWLPPKKGAKAF